MKINWNRVILGGLLAGLVINICEYVENGLILGDQWTRAIVRLQRPAMGADSTAAFLLWGFLVGIYALWLYAVLRPRLGPGPKTAAFAGIAVWVLASLLGSIPPVAMHLFPYHLSGIGIVVSLVENVVGTILGAWLYKEPAAT
jgi:hypothetical protein